MIRDWYLMLFAAVILASACTTPDEAERSLDTASLHETPAQMKAAEAPAEASLLAEEALPGVPAS